MGKIWAFAREPVNLALLIALGGAIGFLWDHFKPQPKPPAPVQTVQTLAGPSAKAVGGDAIAVGTGAQVAKADRGGTAVNAKDQARVHIR